MKVKVFFKSAFTAPDKIIQTNHVFSFKLLLSLLIIGFIVLAILLASVIPVEIGIFGTTRGSLVTSIILVLFYFGCHSRCNIWAYTFSS